MNAYVLDACALLAFLLDEDGAEVVEKKLEEAAQGECIIWIHAVNILEIYYGVMRDCGSSKADAILERINALPTLIIRELSEVTVRTAGRLKATNRLSLADSIAVGEAINRQATLVTADHHELDEIERRENLKFLWIR